MTSKPYTLDDYNREILAPLAEDLHKRMYEDGRALALEMQPDAKLPLWDDLTPEQKETMRQINNDYLRETDGLAKRFLHGTSD